MRRSFACHSGIVAVVNISLAHADPVRLPVTYSFPSVNAAQSAPITHVFSVANTTEKAVTIDHLQPSCGCTSAVLDGAPTQDKPTTIPPHGSVDVRMSIDPSRLSPGNVDKFVMVYVKEQAAAFATLEMKGTLVPGATYSPTSLHFGHVPYSKGAQLPLTVTLDPAILAPKMHAHLISTQYGVEVVPVTPEPPTSPATTGTLTRQYTVLVSPSARLGAFNGVVTMMVSDGHGGERQVSTPAPITGDVVGQVTASPEVVAFAMVTAGEASTQEVTLEGLTPADIPKTKLLVAGDMLEAHFAPLPKNDPRKNAIRLLVSIMKKAKPGSMSSEIVVMMADGSQLLLPVNAYIVGGGR